MIAPGTRVVLNNVPGKRWSPSDVSVLTRWYCKEGRSRESIANELHRTIFSIDNKIERLKLRRRKRALTPKELKAAFPTQLTHTQPYLRSPEKFMDFLDVELYDYQWDGWWKIDGATRTILCWNRQAGKDMLLSLYALHLALTTDSARIVCVSPSKRQSNLWMEKVQDFTQSREQLRNLITDISKAEISFANGSRLTSIPGGMEGAYSIRGFSNVSLIIYNEAAFINEDVFHGTSPFLAANPDAKMVLISTPFGTLGYYYRMWESELYAKSWVTADMCPHITSDFLQQEKAVMPALVYASEYEGQFLSSQTAYFPTELVASVTKPLVLAELPPQVERGSTKYWMGWDPARVKGGDASVITVIAENDGFGQVLWVKEFEGIDYVDQCKYVHWLHTEWRFNQIFVDQSSHAVVDSLRAYRLPVTPISFSLQGKIELFGRLKAAMESGNIIIPTLTKMNQELSAFEYKITESGNITLHGGHDDYVDSLALAANELTKPRVALSVTVVDQNALSGRSAAMKLSDWKETMGFERGNPYNPDEPAKRGFYPWLEPGGSPENCICDEAIMGPRTLINGQTYVNANHPECAEKARLLPIGIKPPTPGYVSP